MLLKVSLYRISENGNFEPQRFLIHLKFFSFFKLLFSVLTCMVDMSHIILLLFVMQLKWA